MDYKHSIPPKGQEAKDKDKDKDKPKKVSLPLPPAHLAGAIPWRKRTATLEPNQPMPVWREPDYVSFFPHLHDQVRYLAPGRNQCGAELNPFGLEQEILDAHCHTSNVKAVFLLPTRRSGSDMEDLLPSATDKDALFFDPIGRYQAQVHVFPDAMLVFYMPKPHPRSVLSKEDKKLEEARRKQHKREQREKERLAEVKAREEQATRALSIAVERSPSQLQFLMQIGPLFKDLVSGGFTNHPAHDSFQLLVTERTVCNGQEIPTNLFLNKLSEALRFPDHLCGLAGLMMEDFPLANLLANAYYDHTWFHRTHDLTLEQAMNKCELCQDLGSYFQPHKEESEDEEEEEEEEEIKISAKRPREEVEEEEETQPQPQVLPVKRKPGRPKGSTNKNKAAMAAAAAAAKLKLKASKKAKTAAAAVVPAPKPMPTGAGSDSETEFI